LKSHSDRDVLLYHSDNENFPSASAFLVGATEMSSDLHNTARFSVGDPVEPGNLNNNLPYILAYKSQNLRQNHAPKVRVGGDLSAGHKIKTFFPGAKIRNFQCTGNQ